MKFYIKTTLAAVSLAVMLAVSTQASTTASDNASNYSSWTNGANAGSGFGVWAMTTSGGGGNYIGATGQGASPSFGIYSSNAGTQWVDRPFIGALTIGQTFSVDLGNTSVANGGDVGLNLMSGSTPEFTLKFVGGNANWLVNDGGSDFGISQAFAANTDLLFTFTYNGGNSYSYTFGTATGLNYTATATINSLDGVRFYSENQGAGENLGFNNLAIVPEPSSMVLIGCGLIGAWFMRRRRV